MRYQPSAKNTLLKTKTMDKQKIRIAIGVMNNKIKEFETMVNRKSKIQALSHTIIILENLIKELILKYLAMVKLSLIG